MTVYDNVVYDYGFITIIFPEVEVFKSCHSSHKSPLPIFLSIITSQEWWDNTESQERIMPNKFITWNVHRANGISDDTEKSCKI